ncbi:IclR family transcriptional regulator [Alphaproteobacteria bacterium KMM 3653]|uniref:IclR family transcriptional regulator n=1 Tax=Harenicola maris TaxID=2841044 RepID=A0AAP2CN32_9RHOB|nr:IclR family transcriptional regulator [Harenicola maris]
MVEAIEEKNKKNASYVISSVDRAAHMLLVLAESPDSGVTELAEATQNTKSLTFRLLHTLERRGLVRKDPERRTYTLGYRALLLGDQSRRQSRLISTADPILAELSQITRENALLLVREDQKAICIAIHESPEPLRIFAAVGRLGPLHAGGGPKVLLAHAPEEVQQSVISGALEAFTEDSISDGDALMETLDQIKADGHVVSVGELDPNIFSVAAPVRDHTGAVIAALAVNGPTARLAEGTLDNVRSAVLTSATKLSQMLGGQ